MSKTLLQELVEFKMRYDLVILIVVVVVVVLFVVMTNVEHRVVFGVYQARWKIVQ
jgi:hypothetical protein